MYSKTFKILIADDNADNIHLLKRRLRRDDYTFYTAMDGQETLKEVKRVSPDLILLDVNMPILDGFEVCRRLRDDERTRYIPIIIITAAKTTIGDRVMGLGLGADDYITKPFNSRDLAARVERKLKVKALEDELRRQKGEMAAILSSAGDAILRIDADERIRFCNPAAKRLFDYAAADSIIGRHYREVFANQPNFTEAFKRIKAKASSQPAGSEVEMDKGRTMFMNVAPIIAQVGQQDGWALILRDISHLKKIDRLKSTIIANAAHDLKNPLSSAILYMEMLVEAIPDQSSDQYTLAASALHSIQRMKDMAVHLLDLERLETGDVLELQPCDLAEIAQDLIHQMNGLAQKQGVSLKAELPNRPLMVKGDFIYLSRAISNLMNNALKFTPSGGVVTIKLEPEGQNAVISVRDTGPGIPADHQSRIFDRFYRVKGQKETRGMLGSGLGLSIVKSIATQHQGLIWLESREGEGTTFYISLPSLADPSAGD